MRITASVSGPPLGRRDMFAGCRGVAYELLRRCDPDIATAMHEKGLDGSGRRPWSMCPPTNGVLTIATPVKGLGNQFAAGARSNDCLVWNGRTLHIDNVEVVQRDDHQEPVHVVERWAVTTPVIVQGTSPKRSVLVPGDSGWLDSLHARFISSANYIGVSAPKMSIRGVGDRTVVQSSPVKRVGAAWLVVEVAGTSAVLDDLSAMGIGTRTTEGFGFVGARKQISQQPLRESR